jgi:hypothetical protein
VKIDVNAATLPVGTVCQTEDSDHEIIVVGCPREINLPAICVYTGKPEGTRHVFNLPVAPSKPAPGSVAAYWIKNAIGATFQIECTLSDAYFKTKRRVQILGAILLLVGLAGIAIVPLFGIFDKQISTIVYSVLVTLIACGPVLFLYSQKAPLVVSFACEKFVLIDRVHPDLTATLPTYKPRR